MPEIIEIADELNRGGIGRGRTGRVRTRQGQTGRGERRGTNRGGITRGVRGRRRGLTNSIIRRVVDLVSFIFISYLFFKPLITNHLHPTIDRKLTFQMRLTLNPVQLRLQLQHRYK